MTTAAPPSYRWTIFHADLSPTMGREQAGERPVLVVSAEALNAAYDVVMVAPLTSRKNNRPARLGEVLIPAGEGGLRVDSFALCHQVRALDKKRLTRRYGRIADVDLQEQILDTLALCFDM
jgi:mRNA interferase MazF